MQERATTPSLPNELELSTLEFRVLDEELARVQAEPHVHMTLGVVLDPRNGHVLAMQSRTGDDVDLELAAREPRSHGSVAKSFSIASAIEFGAIALDDTFSTEGGREAMTIGDVIALSSNVGALLIFERLGRDRLFEGLSRFHLDHRIPEIARTSDAEAARIASGGLIATPLELAVAFAAIANGGVFYAPWRDSESPTQGERVLSPETARTMMSLLEGAVARDDATGRLARVPGHRVAGKTGTFPSGEATIYGSFVGAIPAEAPRYVILIGVLVEGDGYHGGTIAAPAFARVSTRLVAN
jgi:cell division protein FtsI (penicillin-binding protein 3)